MVGSIRSKLRWVPFFSSQPQASWRITLAPKMWAMSSWRLRRSTSAASRSADGVLRLLRRDERCASRDTSAFLYLYEAARNCKTSTFVSLYTFLKYFEKRIADGVSIAPEGGNRNRVSIMTIHKSKGLEFPVVFTSFLAQRFDLRDESAKLILSPEFGPCFHLPEDGGRVKVNTFLRRAAALNMHAAMVEEEMRVLYVALTRPETKLIITAKPQNYKSLARDLLLCTKTPLKRDLTEHLLRGASSPLMLLLLSLRDSAALRQTLEDGMAHTEGSFTCSIALPLPVTEAVAKEEQVAAVEFDPAEILSSLDFEYEEAALSRLPKKLSVSQLLRAGREEEASLSLRRLKQFTPAGLAKSAAQIGTLTHSVMQFADFHSLAADVDTELDRLVEKGFITEEDAALVEKDWLRTFFASDLYQRMKSSASLIREKRFNVLLPAKELLGTEGNVLVQGVIDAWFEEADGSITIVDFKTDRVKAADGEAILLERHSEQLRLYALAVEQLTEKRVGKRVLYSFSLGKEILIP